jgi:phenylacetate-CoA ligase
MIRYRTRDLTRLLPGTARTCAAWRRSPAASDDMLIIRGVNVFPVADRGADPEAAGLSLHYPEPHEAGPLDHPHRAGRRRRRRLQHAIKSYIGISADVKSVPLNTIERSIGKAKRVIDKRPK